MPSTEARQALLKLARESIAHGLSDGAALRPSVDGLPPDLLALCASFVTLQKADRLRGCIGSLQAHRPLYQDVAANAWAAAFRDPRFAPLQESEFSEIALEISLLTPPEPFPVSDEADLLARLQPGHDGLILEDGRHRATFLPAVWESLPDPADFVRQLKLKAGLPAAHWSAGMRVQRYTAVKIRETSDS